ncbi:hypothetical protein [Glycomyces sp. NRRL B-16210]|uniref:hypothetical protein n=1 Tax=Glycomyces sp. NRRL B-16210 TaxID=1463821 RepID=UPI00068E60F9|nr:hypothetical protein [Glycomyces sp. NRRL B-16210]
MTTTAPEHAHRTENPARAALRRWPTVAGIAAAAFLAYGLASGSDLSPILTAAGFIYLGAAALGRRGAAWPLFLLTFVIIGAARFAPFEFSADWSLLGLAALLAVYGLVRGAVRPAAGLPLQALAMAAIGGVAAVASYFAGGDLAAYTVAAALLAHAGWDVYHHRVERVVSRSLAEFCFVLDALLAIVIVVATLRG